MPSYTQPFLLSAVGSDRGTAYRFSNKSLTLGGKTHVVWTDVIAVTRGRTFDHAAREWGPAITIGEGVDNHNNPTITADREGFIHIAYGPHGGLAKYPASAAWARGTFKVGRSDAPNSLTGLDRPGVAVGYKGTYASMLIDHENLPVLAYRGGEQPPSLLLHVGQPIGGWSQALELMRQDIKPGYTNYGAQVAIDSRNTYYVAGRFYSGGDYLSLGTGIVKSADRGLTWSDVAGNPVTLPIRYSKATSFPVPVGDANPHNSGLAVDPQDRVWALSIGATHDTAGVILSRWDAARGEWWSTDLAKYLPEGRRAFQGDLLVDTSGRVHVCTTAPIAAAIEADPPDKPGGGRAWGHPTCEVFHLMSADDGESFECDQVSESNDEVANWFGNMSKPGPYHPVDKPVFLYTQGRTNVRTKTEGSRATTETNIYCVMME